MKVRLSVLFGEFILAVIAVLLVLSGHFEGAIGIAGIIGATMDKILEKEA